MRAQRILSCLVVCITICTNNFGQNSSGSNSASSNSTGSGSTTCTAGFGIFAANSGSSSLGAASSGTNVSVQQTNNASAAKPDSPKSTTSSASGQNGIIKLSAGQNAPQVAAALSGKIGWVTSLVAIGNDTIFYTIDPSKYSAPPAGSSQSVTFSATATDGAKSSVTAKVSLQIEKDTASLVITSRSLPIAYVGTSYSETLSTNKTGAVRWSIKPNPRIPGLAIIGNMLSIPSPVLTKSEMIHVVATLGKNSAAADLIFRAIPKPVGLAISTTILPIGFAGQRYVSKLESSGSGSIQWGAKDVPDWMHVAGDGTVTGTPPAASGGSGKKSAEDELRSLIASLPAINPELQVIPLSAGHSNACDIVTAIGHQVPGVVSLAAVDNTRILAGIDRDGNEKQHLADLTELVHQLEVPAIAPAQPVTSVPVRLYYDRDAVSLANVIGQSFSELRVNAVSTSPTSAYSNTIVLADPSGAPVTGRNALEQARRMIATLDQPRAQVTVNAWSLQIASDEQGKVDKLVPIARKLSGTYNDVLQGSIKRGWTSLTTTIAASKATDSLLDPVFAGYLCGVASLSSGQLDVKSEAENGFCPQKKGSDSYGLGYTTIYDRPDPDLVQMLLVVASSQKPRDVAEAVLDNMEELASPQSHNASYSTCQEDDRRYINIKPSSLPISAQLESMGKNLTGPTRIGFACTRARLEELLQKQPDGPTTSFIGQFRAAIADFLFQNKMKEEYPDDFAPYLYPASGAHLDALLTPVIDAFNQDLEVVQQTLQDQLTGYVPNDKHLSYTSNGLVTVKVVSGNQAQVQTQSASYFPIDRTMKLEQFAQALVAGASSSKSGSGGAGSSGGSGGGGSSGSSGSGSSSGSSGSGSAGSGSGSSGSSGGAAAQALLGGTLSTIIPAIAAYSAAQPAEVTAKVGSGLSLTVTPYTLSSDTGAELNVSVNYNENAAATISSDATQAHASDDLNSRVSQHQVSTLVRMDALKLFEISTMQSVIARRREPWRIADPVVELPILDLFAIKRRKPQVIYGQSIIFLEACIVPTAADLGDSLLIHYDRLTCKEKDPSSRKYQSGSSFDARSRFDLERCGASHYWPLVMRYHNQMIEYLGQQYLDDNGQIANHEKWSAPKLDPTSNDSTPNSASGGQM